jgi:radical SAM superfamily enzyme YgiQ (UPF0313 family)
MVLAFPSTYAVGITSLGYQVVWATLASRSDVNVRRLFTDCGDPPHGGRGGQGRALDLFGLSLSWELDAPVLLDLLEQERIPLWAIERGEGDPLVFGGGPVLTANPEPLAPFLDVVLLGDGEGLLPDFVEALRACGSAPRAERLRALARVPGLYVPSLYGPTYGADGQLEAIGPVESGIPATVARRIWRGNTLSHSTVITPEAAWPSIHMVEVARSCPELCRFCLASYLTLPFRPAELEDGLIPAVETGLAVTRRLGLLGASVTQHPQFADLLGWLDQERFADVRVSVSSVRAATVTPQLSRILASRGSRSLTIAIESGSDRLRAVVNKKLDRQEIFTAARLAREGGLQALKLYGMVGLPTEEDADVEATADLLLELKRATPGLRLTLGVSSFVPKAHTPFQWQGLRPEAEQRLRRLARRLQPKGIVLRPESYSWSVIQTLLSRGDRRLAPVLAAVRGQQDSLGGWKRAYRAVLAQEVETPLPLPPPPPWKELVEGRWTEERVLPWEHLASGLPKGTLWRHQREALGAEKTAQASDQHPTGHIDPAVVHRDVGGMEHDEHQGGGPPGAIKEASAQHAPLGAA